VVDKLAAIGGSKTFVDFLQEPFLRVHQPLYRFFYQRFGGAALLSSHARELGLKIGVELYIHAVSLGLRARRCQRLSPSHFVQPPSAGARGPRSFQKTVWPSTVSFLPIPHLASIGGVATGVEATVGQSRAAQALSRNAVQADVNWLKMSGRLTYKGVPLTSRREDSTHSVPEHIRPVRVVGSMIHTVSTPIRR